MPHLGQIKAILGTLRGDGVVVRVGTSLYVDPDASMGGENFELREDGGYELREDGSIELRD